MTRWVGFFGCAIFGLALLFTGLQVPAHLRAVDVIVLQRAGRGSPSLIEGGFSLVQKNQLGAAQLFVAAAQSAGIADSDKLDEAVDDLATRQPGLRVSGAENGSLDALRGADPGTPETNASQTTL